ncbi:MAG: hypothetical protein RIQ89_2211 [Bacteroidota bacterium]
MNHVLRLSLTSIFIVCLVFSMGAQVNTIITESKTSLDIISKQYNIPLSELQKLNPTLDLKIKKGTLVILKASTPEKNLVPAPLIQQVVTKDLKKVVLALPINFLRSYVTLDSDSAMMDTLLASEPMVKETNWSLDCYIGFKWMMDSLSQGSNTHFEITILDHKNDSATALGLTARIALKEADFIVTSGNGPVVQTLASKLATNQKLIILNNGNNGVTINGSTRNCFQLFTNANGQCQLFSKTMASHYPSAKHIIINNDQIKERERCQFLKAGLPANAKSIELMVAKQGYKALTEALETKDTCIIYFPSSNEASVTALLNALSVYRDKTIILAGLPTWASFETVELEALQKWNTHLFFNYKHAWALPSTFNSYLQEFYFQLSSDANAVGCDAAKVLLTLAADQSKETMIEGYYNDYCYKNTDTDSFINQQIHLYILKEFALVKLK